MTVSWLGVCDESGSGDRSGRRIAAAPVAGVKSPWRTANDNGLNQPSTTSRRQQLSAVLMSGSTLNCLTLKDLSLTYGTPRSTRVWPLGCRIRASTLISDNQDSRREICLTLDSPR